MSKQLIRNRMFIFFVLLNLFSIKAEAILIDTPIPVSDTEEESIFRSHIKEKVRVQNYSEFMSPALVGSGIPNAKGNSLAPAMEDGRVWIEYALNPNVRLLYWQRYFLFPFNDYSIYDPRFGVRLMQVFDVPGLTTTYDFYILPGISQMAHRADRVFETGFRTNTTYAIPKTNWDIGFVSELNMSFYRGETQAKRIWGVLAPWTSYKVSKSFSTQHYFMFPVKYQQGAMAWDVTGMPFIQNGIGWSATTALWFGAFVNNYMFTAPTLKNTWLSLWVNISFI